MALDKQRAIQQQWRIPEKYLFVLCLMGGFLGMHLAMQRHHHKTQHWLFKLIVSFSALMYLIILPMLFLYSKTQ